MIEDKLGEDIILLDIRDVSNFADYFVIASGTSDRMLDSLKNAVLRGVKSKFQKTTKTEGNSNHGWIILDFGDIIVHLFSPEQRDYYRLEDFWQEGKTLLRLQ